MSTSAIIDISIDISKAEALVGKALQDTVKLDKKVDNVEFRIDQAARKILVEQDRFEAVDARAEVLMKTMGEIQATGQAFKEEIDKIKVDLVETEGKKDKLSVEVEETKKKFEIINSHTLATMRRTAAFGTYIFQALGVGVGQYLSLLAETLTLTIETAQLILNLELSSPFTAAIAIGTIGVRLALIASLIYINARIAVFRQKVSSESQAWVGAMRIITI